MVVGVKINPNDGFVQVVATGGQTDLDFDFPLYDDDHITIIRNRGGVITTLTKTTDYTIAPSELEQEAGGTAVLTSGATNGDIYTLLLNVPEARDTDYSNAGDFDSDTLNRELDLQVQMIQQLRRDADKSLRFSDSSSLTNMVVPEPENNKALGWSGGLLVNLSPNDAAYVDLDTLQLKEIDVFLIGGQSNAQGSSNDAANGPDLRSNVAYQYYSSSITALTGDPVGNASDGSAWPSFAQHYYEATGRKICFVPTAVGGSDQSASAGVGATNWDTSGTLYGLSITALEVALTALEAAGWTPVFKGVLWCQGENDAGAIGAATITKSTYKTALQNMIAAYRAEDINGTVYSRMPFYISCTGGPHGGDSTGYQQVRAAQREVAAADLYTHIAFGNAVDFIGRGLMQSAGGETLHYTQAGYNEMGRSMASYITKGLGSEVGTVISSTVLSASGVSLTNNTAANVTSITLPPGDWDLHGVAQFSGAGTTTVTVVQGNFSTVSASVSNAADRSASVYLGAHTAYNTNTQNVAAVLPTYRVSIDTETTYYLVAYSTFAVSTSKAFGTIWARKVL